MASFSLPCSPPRSSTAHPTQPPPAGRAQLINVWRPLRGPVYDMPLAFADARTLDTENDLVRARLLYPTEGEFAQPEGETLTVKHNPAHRWFYLSEMSADEGALCRPPYVSAARTRG